MARSRSCGTSSSRARRFGLDDVPVAQTEQPIITDDRRTQSRSSSSRSSCQNVQKNKTGSHEFGVIIVNEQQGLNTLVQKWKNSAIDNPDLPRMWKPIIFKHHENTFRAHNHVVTETELSSFPTLTSTVKRKKSTDEVHRSFKNVEFQNAVEKEKAAEREWNSSILLHQFPDEKLKYIRLQT